MEEPKKMWHQESKCFLYAALPCIPEQKYLKKEKNWDIWFNCKPSSSNEGETWRTDRRFTSLLEVFVNKCLQRIIAVFWTNTISNERLSEATGHLRIDLEIRKIKWRWPGHILRKANTAVEEKALEWNPQETKNRGRSYDTWRRTDKK